MGKQAKEIGLVDAGDPPSEVPHSALELLGPELPVGFTLRGQEFKTFELGPVQGRLRRELLNKSSPFQQTITCLEHVIKRLGTVSGPPRELLLRLTRSDVDYINWCLCTRELGDTVTWNHTCGIADIGDREGCQKETPIIVRTLDVGLNAASPTMEYDDKGQVFQKVKFWDPIEKRDVPVTFRLLTLGDQLKLFKMPKSAQDFIAELGDSLARQLSALMMDYDNRGSGLSVGDMDNLPMQTFDALMEGQSKFTPRMLDMDIVATCQECGRRIETTLQTERWSDPFASRKGSSR